MSGVSLKPYYLVQPDDFAYVTVTSRNGEKITLAHNTSDHTYIVSSSYIVFCVKEKDLLLSDYLLCTFIALNLIVIRGFILGGLQRRHLVGRICVI